MPGRAGTMRATMPLVIPKSGSIRYVRHEAVLAEILEHVNFDGEDWAVGDRLIFEDGTESRIAQDPRSPAYTWDDRAPTDFDEVKRAAGFPDALDWKELFAKFDQQSKRSGCLLSAAILMAMLTAAMSWHGHT
jgi:hypothetical protein